MTPVLKRVLKSTVKVAAGLLAMAVIATLLLLWRLSSSPIQLNQLIPRIESAVSGLPGGFSVKLKGIGLYWDRAERQVDLRAISVELFEPSGASLVSVPEVDISLSVFALMRGVIALSSIELHDVGMRLVYEKDGTFKVFKKTGVDAPTDGESQARDRMEVLRNLVKTLASDADLDKPISYLKRLRVKGSLEVEDRKNDLNWSVDVVESLIVGHRGELNGRLGLKFSSPLALSGINTDISFDLKGDDLTARVDFSGVNPDAIAELDERFAPLAGLQLSLDGNLDAALTLPGTAHNLSAVIKSGAGQFSHRDYYPQALEINSLNLALSADPASKSMQVSSLDLQLGATAEPLKLQMKGSVRMLETAIAIRSATALQGLQVAELDRYWPAKVANGARTWLVANLQAGVLTNATLDLGMQVPTGKASGFQLEELTGSLEYRDLAVAYFDALPAVIGVNGAGTFDRHGFDLDIGSGQVNGVTLGPGNVLISGLDDGKAAISVKTHLAGPVAAVFAMLEAPPIGLGAQELAGSVSQRLGGRVEADFSLGLPLRSGLAAADFKYRANGRVTNGALRNIYRDLGIQDATIDFEVDPEKVNLSGPMKFAGVPVALDWTANITGPDKGKSDFRIDAADITGAQVSGLGIDVDEYLQGSLALKSSGRLESGGRLSASVETDLHHAALAIPQINWKKNTGDGGKLNLSLTMEKGHLHASDILIDAGTLKSNGNIELDVTGPLLTLTAAQLSLPFAELRGLKLERKDTGDLRFTLEGGEVSLASFLSADRQAAKTAEIESLVKSAAPGQRAGTDAIDFEIGPSALDKVYINDKAHIEQVRFSGRKDDGDWQSLRVSGNAPSVAGAAESVATGTASGKLVAGQFSLVFGPSENDRYPVRLEAANLGALISTIAGKQLMNGGYLVLEGRSDGPLMKSPINASFKLNGFTLKNMPGIVSVLNMASLNQILSTLTQSGLAFRTASGDIQLDGARLSSQQIKMRGGSLGLFVGGWVNLKNQSLQVAGTVVPLSKIHTLVGKVPVLGQVVVGKDGKGVMAVDYKMEGSMQEPKVSVSKAPLTLGILDMLGGDSEEIDPAVRQ